MVKTRTRVLNKRRKTAKKQSKMISADIKSRIARKFLEILNIVKLYHWKTKSYAQHKATDELYTKLNDNIDLFIEVLLGKDASRIHKLDKRMTIMDTSGEKDFKNKIYEYREFLIDDISVYFNNKKDSDLLTVRDEILVNVNQFLYLMTFDK
jgi:DNA-binding ferritin-like protein